MDKLNFIDNQLNPVEYITFEGMCEVAKIITDNKLNNLNPVLFGYDKCAPNHFFGPAIRQYWLIHYIVSGSGIFKIGNFELLPGDAHPSAKVFYIKHLYFLLKRQR